MEEQQLRRRALRFSFLAPTLAGAGTALDGKGRGRGDQCKQSQRQDRDGEKTADTP